MIVNKVTTDSALVIDAVEAVCTNKIDAIAICSGDADFVPLATWMRERGCHVFCFSLADRIFANPESFYDDVVLLEVVEKVSVLPISPSLPMNSLLLTPVALEPNSLSLTNLKQQATLPVKRLASPSVKDILGILPELKNTESMHLSQAAKRLRDAGLLSKNASSVLLFRGYAAQFELTPAKQPNAVRFRG